MAKPAQDENQGFFKKLKQIGTAFVVTARNDRLFLPLFIGAIVVAAGLTVLMSFLLGPIFIPVGVMLAVLAGLIVLSQRVTRMQVTQAEQTPGGVAAIVETYRGDFRVTPSLASTTQMDFVHLVLSRAGVTLLGEGNPGRVKALIGQERKRLAKVIGTAELRDFMIGHDEGEVPLKKLRLTLAKLPRTLSGKEVNALDKRLKALTARPNLPKGAIPKSMRPPKGAFRAMRGGPR